jgi:hypothetical protein
MEQASSKGLAIWRVFLMLQSLMLRGHGFMIASALMFLAGSSYGQNKVIKAEVVKKTNMAMAEKSVKMSNQQVCQHQGLIRRVEIHYPDSKANLPCEVHYKKETEQPGSDKVLWTSSNLENFCQEKAKEFVEKLKGWGWDCKSSTETAH